MTTKPQGGHKSLLHQAAAPQRPLCVRRTWAADVCVQGWPEPYVYRVGQSLTCTGLAKKKTLRVQGWPKKKTLRVQGWPKKKLYVYRVGQKKKLYMYKVNQNLPCTPYMHI